MKPTQTNGAFFHSCYLGSYWGMTFACSEAGTASCAQVPRQRDGVWNQIAIKGRTMRQAVGDWWVGKPAVVYDPPWNPQGKPPQSRSSVEAAASSATPAAETTHHQFHSSGHPDEQAGVRAGGGAPRVPWYTSHFYTNPTCRGYPWY
jgi:hypothetical protein